VETAIADAQDKRIVIGSLVDRAHVSGPQEFAADAGPIEV
jgi:hypothetical protein